MNFDPSKLENSLNNAYGIKTDDIYVAYYISYNCNKNRPQLCRAEFINGIYKNVKTYDKLSMLLRDNHLNPNILMAYMEDSFTQPTNPEHA